MARKGNSELEFETRSGKGGETHQRSPSRGRTAMPTITCEESLRALA